MIHIKVLCLMLAGFVSCSNEGSAVLTVKVISATKDAITIKVRNNSGDDLVLLSPEAPAREVDKDACHVKLSTKVDDRIRPFAFTPQLVSVRGGSETQLRAVLLPLVIPESCADVLVSVEYAFIRPDEVERFRRKPSEDFRQYVLRNQRLVTTSQRVTISGKNPAHASS